MFDAKKMLGTMSTGYLVQFPEFPTLTELKPLEIKPLEIKAVAALCCDRRFSIADSRY
jgi:hypothetical protein